MAFEIEAVRSRFPALNTEVGNRPAVFFDGPAGAQVPDRVLDAMRDNLIHANANTGGDFFTSKQSELALDAAHQRAAELFGVEDPDEVVFGANMTTMALSLARSLAKVWGPGDEVVLSRMEHDANYTPWRQAAEEAGATVREIDLCTDDCTLDLDSLDAILNERTRFVAVGAASNMMGTINPIAEIARRVHRVGAHLFVDAVHYAPHRLMDVRAWDADFVACSAYKFFGPHVGLLWARRTLLETIQPFKLRPSSNAVPHRWMTGTQNHEGIAGTMAAIDYLAELGDGSAGRAGIVSGFEAIMAYERDLSRHLLEGLASIDEIKVWGISDPSRLDERVPTCSITHPTIEPKQIARSLADSGIFVWEGNFYALPLSDRMGLEPLGTVRIGLLHYNTTAEIDRLIGALEEIVANPSHHCP